MQLLLFLSLLSTEDSVRHYIREDRMCNGTYYEIVNQYDYALFGAGTCMMTHIHFETLNYSKKDVDITYGTWKQDKDTIYFKIAYGIGKNVIRKFLMSNNKQQLTQVIDPPEIDVLGYAVKGKIYKYHPGAECPFEVREKIKLKVYDQGHL